MAISSIHIQAGAIGFFAHNSREKNTQNTIFNDEKNYCSRKKYVSIFHFREELKKRKNEYEKRTKQKLQKSTKTLLSAIVNLNQIHDENDIKKVCDYLEKSLDTKVIQFAIHRDEGHIKDNKAIKNYHAHIEFMGLDSKGFSVRRKLTKSYLSNLQTKVSEMLQMDRGKNYAKERLARPKRLDTYEYKAHKKELDLIINKSKNDDTIKKQLLNAQKTILEQKSDIDTQNRLNEEIRAKAKRLEQELEALKQENLQARTELKATNTAQRSDWARLEQENKDKIIQLKEAHEEEISELKTSLTEQIMQIKENSESLMSFEYQEQEQKQDEKNHDYYIKTLELRQLIVANIDNLEGLEEYLKNREEETKEEIKEIRTNNNRNRQR